MYFNSYTYFLFLSIVFTFFWFAFNRKTNYQTILLLLASYFFYACWDWRFLSLIVLSSCVDYYIGNKIYNSVLDSQRKLLLVVSIVFNIGLLAIFKYFNFFISSFIDLSEILGFSTNLSSLNIILPVGISFYTFQTMSYSLDIYRKQLEPTKNIISFFAFVSFFPQLVAGPIERAKNLLPQFEQEKNFNYATAVDGLRQILWGLFKKIAVADTAAPIVNSIFENSSTLPGYYLFIGALLFSFQIYADFSGYSDIAIGTARLFGFSLMQNFRTPYFAENISDFWRRWHISLSTWFRDYVFIPLGGSRGSKFQRIKNIIITFTTSGLWHGANWTFMAWGFIHGLLYIPLIFISQLSMQLPSFLDKLIKPFKILITFLTVVMTWIFFRAENIQSAGEIFTAIFFKWNGLGLMELLTDYNLLTLFAKASIAIGILLFFDFINRNKPHSLSIENWKIIPRWGCYGGLLLAAYVLGEFQSDIDFIYFQF